MEESEPCLKMEPCGKIAALIMCCYKEKQMFFDTMVISFSSSRWACNCTSRSSHNKGHFHLHYSFHLCFVNLFHLYNIICAALWRRKWKFAKSGRMVSISSGLWSSSLKLTIQWKKFDVWHQYTASNKRLESLVSNLIILIKSRFKVPSNMFVLNNFDIFLLFYFIKF